MLSAVVLQLMSRFHKDLAEVFVGGSMFHECDIEHFDEWS